MIPVKDEEEVLPELYRRLDAVARDIQGEMEFILVDDGSTDRSREMMSELRARDDRAEANGPAAAPASRTLAAAEYEVTTSWWLTRPLRRSARWFAA